MKVPVMFLSVQSIPRGPTIVIAIAIGKRKADIVIAIVVEMTERQVGPAIEEYPLTRAS